MTYFVPGYYIDRCSKNKEGYLVLRVKVHRLIYENHHKCCLLDWVDIHHINGIKDDNRIENLEAMPHWIHMQITNKDRKWPIKSRVNFSVVCKGRILSDKHKRNIAKSIIGKRWTLEQRTAFSNKILSGEIKRGGKPLSESHKQKVREGMLRHFSKKKLCIS